MERRHFITAAVATPLLAAGAGAETETEIQRLYSELKHQTELAAQAYRKVTLLIDNCGLTGKGLMQYDDEISSIAYQETSKQLGLATQIMRSSATCPNDVLINPNYG